MLQNSGFLSEKKSEQCHDNFIFCYLKKNKESNMLVTSKAIDAFELFIFKHNIVWFSKQEV